MWALDPRDEYERRLKKWPKKHKRELAAMLHNLDTFLKALQGGQKPAAAKFGFIHPEPCGALAVDQKGAGSGVKECRLYIYPDEVHECVRLMTLGDKDSQPEDIQTCKNFVEALRKEGVTEVSHLTGENP